MGATRRRRRTATTLAAAGALALPAIALAASVNHKIPNGYYATVGEPKVPGGEDVEFTLHNHSTLTGLALGCTPDAADAALIANSGYAGILLWVPPGQVSLTNGSFSYNGPAKVTAGYLGAPQVDTATLTLNGHYVRKGPVYHYAGGILGEKVTAMLIFEGTANSTACTGLPADLTFRLYHTTHTGG
jgi:hypothetical protein